MADTKEAPIMPAWLTIAMTVAGAVAPYITPLLEQMPHWGKALWVGSVAGLGSIYHLYQTPPSEPSK